MPLSDDDPVWYAAYGSNCLSARFLTYLHGGTPDGAASGERGARDRRTPTRSEPYWFPMTVRFLGDSAKWGGGGIAFLDHERRGRAAGRRYLVTKGQFDDVAAQESRRDLQSIPIHLLTPGEVTPFGTGPYDGVSVLEEDDGVPVVTFTSPRPRLGERPSPPSSAYLATIVRGLLEVHEGGVEEIVPALLECPGVASGWTAERIAELAVK